MKEGDIGVELLFTVKRKDGVPLVLDSLTNATLYWKFEGSDTVEDRELEEVDRDQGQFHYVTEEGDLIQPGKLFMEVKLEFSNGNVFTSSTVKAKVEDAIRPLGE